MEILAFVLLPSLLSPRVVPTLPFLGCPGVLQLGPCVEAGRAGGELGLQKSGRHRAGAKESHFGLINPLAGVGRSPQQSLGGGSACPVPAAPPFRPLGLWGWMTSVPVGSDLGPGCRASLGHSVLWRRVEVRNPRVWEYHGGAVWTLAESWGFTSFGLF